MAPHEEFLELCAAATAGELRADEQKRLEAHLSGCADCRGAMREYEIASRRAILALASEHIPADNQRDDSWSLEEAEKTLFKRLDGQLPRSSQSSTNVGQRFTYRPSRLEWRAVWMSLAAVVLLAIALAVTAYRTGVKRGAEIASTTEPAKPGTTLEEQASDAGHERAQLLAQVAEQDSMIGELKRQVAEEHRRIGALKGASEVHSQKPSGTADRRDARDLELAAAEAKLLELQRTIDTLTGQRNAVASEASSLDAKVAELTQLVRDREREVDEKQEQIAKQQDLLDHDRDIRELMGARDLYVAEVHDVAGTGQTDKTYGRIFYTRGKRLIFYAYDLDGQPGLKSASTFQAWGRRGPAKEQARSLGIFYEDNAGKKRWVLKATDPQALDDIDAVFVTVEPNGGSQHPSGKPLLFAYLRVSPNHP